MSPIPIENSEIPRSTNPVPGSEQELIQLVRLLIQRLERISADSVWAHRSSGQRGALLRFLDAHEAELDSAGNRTGWSAHELERLTSLIESGFYVLENAARELSR